MRSTEVRPRHFTLNKVPVPAHSVDLITAAMYEAFLPAGGRALAEAVFMAVVSMVADLMAAVAVVDRAVA